MKRLASLATVFLFSALLHAQAPAAAPAKQRPAAAPIPSYEQLKYPPLGEVRIPAVATHTMPNGARVFLLENRELPLISGFVLVRTGNLFDPPEKTGLAQLTGMVLRTGGTRERSGDELDQQLEDIAATVESSIGETSGSISFNSLKENIGEVLEVVNGLLRAPEFRQDKLDLAKTQLRGLIARRNDDASSITSREFAQIVYGRNTPYGRRIEYEHLEAIQRDDLVAFHKRYFFPANVIIALQGDFSAPDMQARLEKLFGSWDARQPGVPPFPEVSAKPAPGIHLAVKEDVTQAFFSLGHVGGQLKDKDYPALEVMNDILGGSFASRLFRRVRTELGYAYNVGSRWGANYNHRGLFRVSGSTKSPSTADALQVIIEEVERIRSGEVSDDELEAARQTVLNSFVFNFDHPGKTLNRLVNYEYHGYPKDFIFQYQKAVAAVTKADILRVARENLRLDDLSIVVVGKPQDFGKPLAALGRPVHPIDLTIPQPKRELAQADAASLERGKQLLAKVQADYGGVEKLAAVRDFSQRSDAVLQAGPGGGLKVRQHSRFVAPAHTRQDQELPFGKISSYFDGKSGWLSTPQGVQPLPAEVARQIEGSLFRFAPIMLLSDRNPDRKVNYAGEGVLEVSDSKGNSVRLVVDESTGRVLRSVYQMAGMGGAPTEVEETYEDWREASGLMLPHKILIRQAGRDFGEIRITETLVNSGLTVEELSKQP